MAACLIADGLAVAVSDQIGRFSCLHEIRKIGILKQYVYA
jgi:hypothetical protein